MEFKRTNEFDAPIASTKYKIVSGVQNRTPNDQHYDGEPGIDPKGMPGVWREEWDRQGGHPVFVFQLLEDLWMQSSNSSAHISIVVHDRLNEL